MGNEPCAECAGVGQILADVKCPPCKGKGQLSSKIECPKCSGSGRIKRPYFSMSEDEIQFCATCGGNDNSCSVCGGSGRVNNTKPKYKDVKCDFCKGKRQTDKCEECYGGGTVRKQINCVNCEATGKTAKK